MIFDCITEIENKGTVERVENEHSPGYYSIIFVRPKKNGKLRPIIDLSILNKHIITPTFRMENAQSIKQFLHKANGSRLSIKGRVFPYTHQDNIQEIHSVLFPEPNVAVQSTTVQSVSDAPNNYCNISFVAKLCHEQGINIHYQWREDKHKEIHKVIQSTPEIDTIVQWWTRPHLWNLSVPLAPLVAHLHLLPIPVTRDGEPT